MKSFRLIITLVSFFIIFSANPGFAQEKVTGLTISVQDDNVLLTWDEAPQNSNFTSYKILRDTPQGIFITYTPVNYYVEPFNGDHVFYQVFYDYENSYNPFDEVLIEDFESGNITLTSYPGQDHEPDRWELQSDTTFQGSDYALFVYGNTWKMQEISAKYLEYNTMWGIAIETYNGTGWNDDDGEIMGFGVGDGENELFYTFRGSQMADSTHWRNTFFWWGEERVWKFFYLPIGRDWSLAYGYEPYITSLIYVNDEDAANSNGGIYFDYICDVTEDMPLPPTVSVDYQLTGPAGLTVDFFADAEDPDSDTLLYYWEFGDGTDSEDQNPTHTYESVEAFSVQVTVSDETGLVDRASIELVPSFGGPNSSVRVNFVGDCMMGRRYWQESWSIIPNYGANAIWEPSLDILGNAADLTFGNLECTFSSDVSQTHPTKQYIFYGHPEYLNALVYAGFDGVTLANNHITDYMYPGITETMFHLDTTGIKHTGAGMDEYEAMQPMVHFSEGVSIATLGYCNRTGRADNLPPFMEAAPNKFGFTWFTPYAVEQTVPEAANLYDIVVVQVHAGTEYAITPDTTLGGDNVTRIFGEEPFPPTPLDDDSTTLDMQRLALDLGADIVVAHHPHVLQGYEVYNGKIIAHSMGNFAFDQYYFETFISMILYVDLTRDGIYKAWFKPVYIDDYYPGEAYGELGKGIIHKIADYSKDLNTVVMPDYENNIAYIALDDAQVSSYETVINGIIEFPLSGTAISDTSYPKDIGLEGFISSLAVSDSSPGFEVQFGREMLLIGNFEDEGSTVWEVDNYYETYDDQIVFEGDRSLKIYQYSTQNVDGQVFLGNRSPINHNGQYSVTGNVKGINARNARIDVKYYEGRTSGGGTDPVTIGEPITGTQDWTYFSADLEIPDSGNYINIFMENESPIDDEGYAWFDEVKLIRWEEEWHPLPTDVSYPNNYSFIRIRGLEPEDKAIEYELVYYNTP